MLVSMEDEREHIRRIDAAVEAIDTALSRMAAGSRVEIACFNDFAWSQYSGEAGLRAEIIGSLREIEPAGGTNLMAGLEYVIERHRTEQSRGTALLVITDGEFSPDDLERFTEVVNAHGELTVQFVWINDWEEIQRTLPTPQANIGYETATSPDDLRQRIGAAAKALFRDAGDKPAARGANYQDVSFSAGYPESMGKVGWYPFWFAAYLKGY